MPNLQLSALPPGMRWCFESLDAARRRRGATLDVAGFGPRTSQSTVMLETPALRLHRYAEGGAGPAALIVPAPIKRHYIWDLGPGASVVRHAIARGLSPFMIEWKDPQDDTDALDLAAYGGSLLEQCMTAVASAASVRPVFLLAHSLGGVFATIYAALRPERVAGVVLIESPLHFAAHEDSFQPLLAVAPPARELAKAFGNVPGSVLSMASMAASPTTFGLERYADLVASMGSRADVHRHFQVERWTLDEAPMAAALFEDIIELLYRQDCLYRGVLDVGGRRTGPDAVIVPQLAVYDPHSRVIPPASIIDFHEAAASPRKQLLRYEGDTGVGLAHVGALIGANAHRQLWPAIFDWLGSIGAAGNG